MGWYFQNTSRKQLVEQLTTDFRGHECVKSCYRGNPYSGVVWSVWQHENGKYIRCDLVRYQGGQWGHKPMDESVGPCYYSCPLSYLKMVPVRNEKWREKVRNYHKGG